MASRWGQGRVEVLALRDEIGERLAAGHSIRSIYEKFKITVGYERFRQLVRKLSIQAPSRLPQSPPSADLVAPSTTESLDTGESDGATAPFRLDHFKKDSDLTG